MSRPARIRRSPEEARKAILDVAAKRLADFGMRGLNIKDIANEAGINHATVLHHFGSAEQMRTALLNLMTERLVNEMSAILNSQASSETVVEELFGMMSQSGHIKLLAWRAMEDIEHIENEPANAKGQLFHEMTESVLNQLRDRDIELARNLIFLAFSSAIGWGLCCSGFRGILGHDESQQDEFPAWVGTQLSKLINN